MLRFNNNELVSFLNEFEEITCKIGTILGSNPKPDSDFIAVLTELYGKRRSKLELMNEWLQSRQGIEFKTKNRDYWDKYVTRIMQLDRKNIKDIKNCVDNLNMELKKMINSKNVLIYI